MKYKIFSLLFLGVIYAQCENFGQFECNSDENCEWVEDLECGSCSSLSSDACSSTSECNWEYGCIQWGSWYTWLCYDYGYECTGGTYQVDNGYCEEIMMPGCSELDQNSCNHPAYGDGCEWVEDITMASCSQFDNSENSCTDYPGECFWDEDITYASCDYPNSGICNSVEGCYWDCYYGYCDCYGQQQIVDTECIGQYDIDNSYCQEVQMPECSQMLEGQCDDNEDCEWVEDIANMSCSGFTIETCNMQDGCFLDQDCEQWGSWYSWICYDYGPLYCSGSYESDNSYCEEISVEYLMGDINNDFIINILDVIEIINLILDGEHLAIVDMNYDHSVNVLDIIILVDIILNPTRL